MQPGLSKGLADPLLSRSLAGILAKHKLSACFFFSQDVPTHWTMVFVSGGADADVRLARRIRRDTVERGRDVAGVIEQVWGWYAQASVACRHGCLWVKASEIEGQAGQGDWPRSCADKLSHQVQRTGMQFCISAVQELYDWRPLLAVLHFTVLNCAVLRSSVHVASSMRAL